MTTRKKIRNILANNLQTWPRPLNAYLESITVGNQSTPEILPYWIFKYKGLHMHGTNILSFTHFRICSNQEEAKSDYTWAP